MRTAVCLAAKLPALAIGHLTGWWWPALALLAALTALACPVQAATVAEYRFEQTSYNGSAGEVVDSSGNGNHGRMAGSVSSVAAGKTCRGMQVASNTTSTVAALNTGLDVNSIGNSGSIAFWYRSVTSGNEQRMLFDASTGSGGKFHLYRAGQGTGVDLNFLMTDAGGTGRTVSKLNVMSDATWAHITVTWLVTTGSNASRLRLYVDGTLQTTQTYTIASGSLHSSIDTLYVGDNRSSASDELNSANGSFDQVRIYNHELNGTEVSALVAETPSCVTLLAAYNFEEGSYNGTAGEWKDSAGHASGPFNGKTQGSPMPSPVSASPARSGSTGTCGYAHMPGPAAGGGDYVVTGLPVSSVSGAQTSVSFWMYWDGTDTVGVVGWNTYALGFLSGSFGFNTLTNDIQGIANTGLANGWHHVVAVFTNGSVTGSLLYVDGVAKTLSQRGSAPILGNAVVSSNIDAGGYAGSTSYRFKGRLDELRIYNGALNASEVTALYNETHGCQAVLLARYDFDEASYTGAAGEWKDTAAYASGPYNGRGQGASMPTTASTTPARSSNPGTCSYASLAGPASNGPSLFATGLPTTTTAGAKTTVAFWMRWSGADDGIVLSFGEYDLWFSSGHFGFNTNNADVYGIASSGMSGVWKHVVAVFVNGSITSNLLYIDGVQQSLSQRTGSPNNAKSQTSTTLQLAGYTADAYHRFSGLVDSLRVYSAAPSSAQVAALYAETPSTCTLGPARLRIEHGSGSGLTCTPSTLTVRACADAACSADYTSGVSGTLSATGGSVVWPAGAGFSITAGSATTTVSLQVSTTTATVLGTSSSSPSAGNATTCNFGSPVCSFSAADSGLLFDVPNHVAERSQTVSVSAVRKSDNATVCTPAFASVSRSIKFRCAYNNPGTGTLPVRVGGVALNAANNGAAACDGSDQTVGLAFNASGVASTSVLYADAGQLTVTATYNGSAGTNDTGLVMSGSDSFIAAPDHFLLSGITAGPIKAGNSFSTTVTARNAAGATTPNYGRESSAESALLGWTRVQPTGAGAVNGSFSGSLGAFSSGVASSSNLAWTEVGRGDLVARGSNGSGYLGSGLRLFGASPASGARWCANEGGSCVLPGGTTAIVYYGEHGGYTSKAGQTGSVACTNANFGDPLSGTTKRCHYVASTATNGSVGDFIPHHFSVAANAACSSFSYAGQPFASTVTAQNAAGNTTVNFNGTASTTPSFAQAVTLSDATPLGLGTLAGNSIAASAFGAGVATAAPSYAFTSKTTAPQSLVLRASNGGAGAALISSLGYTEPSMPLRSGRLRLSNAFGKATAALQLAAVTEYWGGSAWTLNSADSCTTVAAASVVLSNPRSATGAAGTATTSASALAISGGNGSISLAAPSPAGSSLSLDVAVNLGSTGTDQSCQTSHPASTGAGKAWLRAQNGSCAATADRDPAARASFGIFSPETRKTVHVREIF